MTDALSKYMGNTDLALTDQEYADAMMEAADDASTGSGAGGVVDFLSFSGKYGTYKIGRKGDALDPDEPFIVEPRMFSRGWICWKGGKPVGRHQWQAADKSKAIAREDLEDHGPYSDDKDGWKEQLGMGLISTDGKNTPVSFSVNSKSGVNAIADFVKEVGTRMRDNDPSMPVITFGIEEFEAQGNKNFKPVFNVDVWADRPSVGAFIEGSLTFEDLLDGEEVAAKPAPRKRAAKAKAAPEAKEKAAPKRGARAKR